MVIRLRLLSLFEISRAFTIQVGFTERHSPIPTDFLFIYHMINTVKCENNGNYSSIFYLSIAFHCPGLQSSVKGGHPYYCIT